MHQIWQGTIIKPDQSYIKDIQLWSHNSQKHACSKLNALVKCVGYIEPNQVPTWSIQYGALSVHTDNDEALQEFKDLFAGTFPDGRANSSAGLLLDPSDARTHNYFDYLMIYCEKVDGASPKVNAVCIHFPSLHTSKILPDCFASREALTKPSRLQASAGSQREPQQAVQSKRSSLDKRPSADFYRLSQEPSPSPSQGTDSTATVANAASALDEKSKAYLQAFIMAGLRLRQITRGHHEYRSIYQQTYRSAVFALRKSSHVDPGPVLMEKMQDTVEQLLNLYCD